ncbi:MAG TPA: hypothetical protein VGK61_05510 [Planctomycetota bacterium]|jgi:hypothetical protein
MPIKSCTRCGLKVLVDASQAASDTYLCPRCVSEAKGPAAAPKPAASAKRSSVKLLCPYCGASFSGSIPSRPAKGGCPVCQKELVLLPDGTIQAAASFNLNAWQKQREAKKAESTPPAAPAEAMPASSDPIGGSTILDMGGPPAAAASLPTLEEGPMEFPGGLGGETMLGMGGQAAAPAPRPTIDEPADEPGPPPSPPPEEPARSYDEPEPPPPDDLGGETILDSDGPRAVELPEPSLEDKSQDQDLLRETMPGMDRPPAAETPVPPPTTPPIPEEEAAPTLESDEAAEPTVRDSEYAPPVDPEPPSPPMEEPPAGESEEASSESSPELPGDMGGSTMLGIGGSDDMAPPRPEPIPTIEEPTPEAVPILAKDVAPIDMPTPEGPEPPADADSAEPEEAKPYVYGPIARVPRKVPGSMGPPPPPATVPRPQAQSGPLTPPPPPPTTSNPVLGSDFRIATAPPPPKTPLSEAAKAAGVKTSQVQMPPARPNLFRVVLAWILLLLPLAAGFALYSTRKTSAVEKIIQKLTDEVTPGFRKMDEEIKKAITKPAEPDQK